MADKPSTARGVFNLTLILIIVIAFGWAISKGCNIKSTPNDPCDKNSALVAAEDFMRDRLKNPAGADFAFVSYEDVVTVENGKFTVISYVDATNSFNAVIRTHFKAVMTCNNGTFTLVDLITE